MRYSKPSNTFFTATTKNLLVMAFAMFTVSCSEKEPVFTGKEYSSEDLTANLFANPLTFRDKDGNLVTGFSVRLHPNGQIYSKSSFKDGIMHGPFVSYWSNGQMQMSVVWDEGLRYKKMRSWDRNGKRFTGTGEMQMKKISEQDPSSIFQTFSFD